MCGFVGYINKKTITPENLLTFYQFITKKIIKKDLLKY